MTKEQETQEAKINQNLEVLRRTFEPLTADLPSEVEPAVIYRLPQPNDDHS